MCSGVVTSREWRLYKLSDAIVHLGIAKTGTTSLQAWLTSNRSYLHAQGIAALSALSCHRLAVECMVDPLVCSRKDVLWIKETESLAKIIEDIERHHHERSDIGVFMFSSEYLSLASAEIMAELFHQLHLNVTKIIVYFRRQDLYAASGYSQDVKALGQSKPFDKLGDTAYTKDLCWNIMVQRWRRYFPGACIKARNYDRRRANNALLGDFKNLVGCQGGSAPEGLGRENLSLDSERTEVARLLNERGRPIDLQYLMKLQTNDPKPAFGLSRLVTQTFERRYRQSNEALSRAFPGEFEDWLTAGWLPQGVDMTQTITEERFAAILSHASSGADSQDQIDQRENANPQEGVEKLAHRIVRALRPHPARRGSFLKQSVITRQGGRGQQGLSKWYSAN
jgi:hypothetical protein